MQPTQTLLTSIILSAALLSVTNANATPVRLDYSVSGTGIYHYDFNLVLDNHDSSWSPGQTVSGIVFGDSPSSSPFNDFIGDPASLPIGPFTSYTNINGSHNGPMLLNISSFWSPTAVGNSLHWSGTSATFLGQGQLQFSTLMGTMATANFEVAHLQSVPIPAAAWLFVSGLIGLAGIARKHKTS